MQNNNKVYNSLVTGGLRGIGRVIVDKLQQRGDNVFVFDIIDENHSDVQKLKDLNIKYFVVDVSDIDSIKKGFLNLYSMLDSNNQSLDILVNNAGITRDNIALRLTEKDWDNVLNVNLKGTFFCCQQALKKMMRQEKSYIVNISSIVGIVGNAGQVNYAASKAGVISLTKSLAAEYGSRNILVNAIAPGFIQTDMTEKLSEDIQNKILQRISLKRFGMPSDVANLVTFLSSGNADYINGAVINVNGGLF